jgi:hypothetical protein
MTEEERRIIERSFGALTMEDHREIARLLGVRDPSDPENDSKLDRTWRIIYDASRNGIVSPAEEREIVQHFDALTPDEQNQIRARVRRNSSWQAFEHIKYLVRLPSSLGVRPEVIVAPPSPEGPPSCPTGNDVLDFFFCSRPE